MSAANRSRGEGRVKRKSVLLVLIIAVIGGLAAVCLAQRAPAFPGAAIVPPDPSLPDEVKALIGHVDRSMEFPVGLGLHALCGEARQRLCPGGAFLGAVRYLQGKLSLRP